MDRQSQPAAEDLPQRVWVFQQSGSGVEKIKGIGKYGKGLIELKVFDIDDDLPPVIDDATAWLPQKIEADLVLDYLKHPDLSDELAHLCRRFGVPVISSGKKGPLADALTPATCCALARQKGLGAYARIFGLPEFRVTTARGRIKSVEVLRGAPCGATWNVARKLIGMDIEEAKTRVGLEAQFCCTADPAGWDPISGKSPVHIAGELHKAGLVKALKNAEENP